MHSIGYHTCFSLFCLSKQASWISLGKFLKLATKKINVHCVIIQNPLQNDNQVSVGAIIRDTEGENLWGALGLLPNQTEEQALMSGIQAALIHAQKKKWDLLHIETTNRHVYDTIRHQEHIFLDEDQLEVYSMFNTIYANHFAEGKTKRVIACIPQRMNGTAEYMANYGLEKGLEFGEFNGTVGNMDYFLARDMGMTMPLPNNEALQNLGEGEVIDGPPPPKKQKLGPMVPVERPLQGYKDKGKTKVMEHYSFNNKGLFSVKAVKALSNGSLGRYSPVFNDQVVNLNAVVGNGIYARDILHHAVIGTLRVIIPKLYASNPVCPMSEVDELMTVEQALTLLGFNPDKASSSTPLV